MTILNQYSLLIALIAGGGLFGVLLWKWRRPPWPLRVALLVGYVVLALVLVSMARYPGPTVDTVAEVEATLENGRPTFVMLYSNY